ncbi:MAG: hypothetical protein HQ567_15770 [Candidatus Nealsonbacteria bacterium]|nr:hypothetical protein [Candidatus Nealsonbacteria bacterium]
MTRPPDRFAEHGAGRHRRKWEEIVAAFMSGELERLRSVQRTGTRGRVFSTLVKATLEAIQMPFQPEPIFDHLPPKPWYRKFASEHGLKLREHPFYNPDFLLEDGTWVEVTLSENTAYKKLFRFGHQSPQLTVIWLDEDEGLHKTVCKNLAFPNAIVTDVKQFYLRLANCSGGAEIVENMERLRELRGVIL